VGSCTNSVSGLSVSGLFEPGLVPGTASDDDGGPPAAQEGRNPGGPGLP